MYNEVLLKHVANPHHMEAMEDADGIGQVGFPGEGPFMIFYLKMGEDGRIQRASFETYGCPSAVGCGSWLAKWVEGKTAQEVTDLVPEELMVVLGGLPLGKEHNAIRTIEALRYAVGELNS
jgi:NifU-like protein involved in Fe-S cluster formation